MPHSTATEFDVIVATAHATTPAVLSAADQFMSELESSTHPPRMASQAVEIEPLNPASGTGA
jgi:hypothetical protein